jgi:FkbM family methyltransferase
MVGHRMTRLLGFVARRCFRLGRLQPDGEWRFGAWNRRFPLAWVRRLLWSFAHHLHFDGPVVTPWFAGLRFQHHLVGDMSRCTFVDGRYEPNEMSAVAARLRPGMCVLDVGAHEGLYTLLAARLVSPGGTVHAFEPSPRERARLQENIALNQLTNVQVHETAVGDAAGTAVLHVAGADYAGHNTMGAFGYPTTTLEAAVEVEVVSLDTFASEHALPNVDLLKIDVEGSETSVLRGAQKLLRKHRPVILVEAQDATLGTAGSSVDELIGILQAEGYRVMPFGPDGLPCPLDDRPGGSLNLLCVDAGVEASRSAADG